MIMSAEKIVSLPSSVIAIGAFDGVHQGHQEVINQTVRRSKILGVPSVVYTFDPPPRCFFKRVRMLTTVEEKIERILSLGIDHIVIANFDEVYTKRKSLDFVTDLTRLAPKELLVGKDFRFGRNREGDINLLSEYFPVRITEPVYCPDGQMISSTRIRQLLSQGDIQKSCVLLGW
ncbi:FAD synthetase [Brevibacillus daliensis]|uniref:FAD synthetase n=1 Tax=Brevibacillus daliensis TaxID=2892995 RepID=UPI0035A1CD7C